ncbi:MAG: hypothetical protein ACREJ2_08315 [Planctomycetota bacterium]
MSTRGPSTSLLRSKPLGEILREQGTIDINALSQALAYQREHPGLLGQILVKMKACEPEALAEALLKQVKITDINLSHAQIRISAATMLSRLFCEENKLLPFEQLGRVLCVSMANPLNRACIVELEKTLDDVVVKTFRSPWPEIQRTIERAYAAAEQKKSRLQAAVQVDADGNPLPGSGSATGAPGTPTTVAVASRPNRPLSGLHPNLGAGAAQPGFERPPSVRVKLDEAGRPAGAGISGARAAVGSGQPGFERPPSVRLTGSGASGARPAVASATATPPPAKPAQSVSAPAPKPLRPATQPRQSGVGPAANGGEAAPALNIGPIRVDDSWVDTQQNPHVVFHQRMIKTIGQVGGAPGFLGRQVPDDQRQKMVVTLGLLIAEHGAFLRDSSDFTLAPEAMKLLDWRTLVLRGLFCYHMSYPYVFAQSPKAFVLASQQDVADVYEKVRAHFKLFLKEINGVRNHPEHLVHVNQLEVDDTLSHVERIYLLLPNAQGHTA